MAFGAGTHLGSGGSAAANQGSIVATLAAQANANTLVVLIVAMDNFQTTDGDEGAVIGLTDSTGLNTWVKPVEMCNGQGGSQAGATVAICYSHLTATIPAGGTITVTLSNSASRDATAWCAQAFTKGTDSTIVVDKTATLANDATGVGSLNTAATVNTDCLRVRGIASETNSTTFLTPTTNWNTIAGARSGSGSAASAITVRAEFRIVSGTGALSAPTYVSADHASAYVAFREARRLVAGAGTYTLAGQQATLRGRQAVLAGQGTYGLIGGDVGFVKSTAGVSDTLAVADAPVAAFAVAGARIGIELRLLVADVGTYAATGQPATLIRPIRGVLAAFGSYGLVGMPAATRKLSKVTASQGAYAVGGQIAILRSARKTTAAFGAYGVSGQAAGLAGPGPRSIMALRGAFTLTGGAVNLVKTTGAVADPLGVADAAVASFPVAGGRFADFVINTTLDAATGFYFYVGAQSFVDRVLTVAAGTYTLDGRPAALSKTAAASIVASQGSYGLAGQVAVLRSGRRLVAAVGTYSAAGQPAILRSGRRIISAFGTYAVAGQAAGLRKARTLAAGTGPYTLAGQQAGKRQTYRLVAAVGTYALGGQPAALSTFGNKVIGAGLGTYTLAGQAAVLRSARKLVAAFGTYTSTGQAVGLRRAYTLAAGFGAYTLGGQQAGLRRAYRLTAAFGPYTLAGQPAAVSKTKRVIAGAGTYGLTGRPAGLKRGFTLAANVVDYTLAGQDADTQRRVRITAAFGAYTYTGQPVALSTFGNKTIAANVGTYVLTGRAATLIKVSHQAFERGTYAVAGQAVGLRRDYVVSASTGYYEFTGSDMVRRRRATIVRGTVSGRQLAAERPPAIPQKRRA